MLKKLDKLIIKAFFPPFFLTFFIVVFILLTQFMLKYFDDFVGKNLSYGTYAELLFFFSINSVPLALPISILLSSIMTYGNLSEHNELTAIKSAGISLIRIIQPIFFVVCGLTVMAFYFNNIVVPFANLRAYSLLYDITTKKAAFNIKEGTFYYGLPGFAVKINKKGLDGSKIEQIMIYNHQDDLGNVNLTLADSGKMYTMWNDRYLILELYRGDNYTEMPPKVPGRETELSRNHYDYSKLVLSLSSFELSRTDMQLFASNKIMRKIDELHADIDSIGREGKRLHAGMYGNYLSYFSFFNRNLGSAKLDKKRADSLFAKVEAMSVPKESQIQQGAMNQIRSLETFAESYSDRTQTIKRDLDVFDVEIYRKYTQSIACLIMFLVGAPLGAIIKKGGFGIPVLISIFFFIIYYIFSLTGEKWAKENVIDVPWGMWATNFVLFWVGLYFLSKARTDSALLENNYITQAYQFLASKVRARLNQGKEVVS